MNWYADFFCKHRWLLAACVAAVTAVALVGAVRVRPEDEPRNVIRRSGPDFDKLQELYRDFGPDDNDLLVVIDGEELFTVESIAVFREIVEQSREVGGVESVFSIFDVRRRGSRLIPLVPRSEVTPEALEAARKRALAHPAVVGHLLSEDATTMIAVVRLAGDSLSIPHLKPLIARLREIAAQSSAGSPLRVRLASHQVARLDVTVAIWREAPRLLLFGGIISTIIALVLFRRLAPVLIAAAGPAVGVAWTLGVLGWTGEKLNALSTALPTLVFVIGFTDSVHLVIDMRRKRAAGQSRIDSVRHAIHDVGPACALTSLTTMVGFGSLVITELEVVRSFGIDCACGTFLSFLAVITVAPLLASTPLGDFLVAKRAVRNERGEAESKERKPRFAFAWFLKYRWIATALSLAISIGLIAMSLNLRADIRWMDFLPDTSETKQVWQHCDAELGGTLLTYVVVDWPTGYDVGSPDVLRALKDVHAVLGEESTLRSPYSVLNILLSFSRSGKITSDHIRQLDRLPSHIRDRLVCRNSPRAVVVAYVPDASAAELLPLFSGVDKKLANLEQRHPGFRMHLTGTSVVASRNVHRIIGDLAKSLALATLVIFVVMSVALRSIRLGLISSIPNAFPLAFAAALLVATGEPLRLASAITFSVCLGIAVDDTIHFLTRFRREVRAGSDIQTSVVRTVRAVGVAMLVTSVTLLGGFSVMMPSQMPSIQIFSQLAGVAILAALFGDLVMLPALLLCFSASRRPEKARRREADPA